MSLSFVYSSIGGIRWVDQGGVLRSMARNWSHRWLLNLVSSGILSQNLSRNGVLVLVEIDDLVRILGDIFLNFLFSVIVFLRKS